MRTPTSLTRRQAVDRLSNCNSNPTAAIDSAASMADIVVIPDDSSISCASTSLMSTRATKHSLQKAFPRSQHLHPRTRASSRIQDSAVSHLWALLEDTTGYGPEQTAHTAKQSANLRWWCSVFFFLKKKKRRKMNLMGKFKRNKC